MKMNKIPDDNEIFEQIMDNSPKKGNQIRQVGGLPPADLGMPEIRKPDVESSFAGIFNLGLKMERSRQETKANLHLEDLHYQARSEAAEAELQYRKFVIGQTLEAAIERVELSVQALRDNECRKRYLSQLRLIVRQIDEIRDGDDPELVKKLAMQKLTNDLRVFEESWT